jgi:hypothetical protein
MAKLNIEELVSGLLEAALVASSISERQHINTMRNYFDDKGNPKTTSVKIKGKDVEIPLYILADHSSIGLEELDIEFEANLNFGGEPSSLKKSLLGIFKKKGYDEHNIKGIEVDNQSRSSGKGSTAKIKVKFKSDTKPEMVSRLVDSYIQSMDTNTSHEEIE